MSTNAHALFGHRAARNGSPTESLTDYEAAAHLIDALVDTVTLEVNTYRLALRHVLAAEIYALAQTIVSLGTQDDQEYALALALEDLPQLVAQLTEVARWRHGGG